MYEGTTSSYTSALYLFHLVQKSKPYIVFCIMVDIRGGTVIYIHIPINIGFLCKNWNLKPWSNLRLF